MTDEKEKPFGRPRKEIDWMQLDKLCTLQCTLEEIAGWFECSEENIRNKIKEKFGMTFLTYSEQKKAGGKISLRRMQFQTAEKGNVTMQIWLGKQWLAQSDKQEQVIHDERSDNIDLSKLSDDELKQFKELIDKSNK